MHELAVRRLISMFQNIAASVRAEKERLSDLDGAIGDADHGITMSLGFTAVNAALAKCDAQTLQPSDIFSVAATAFLDAVGASTGPLYATAFRRTSQALQSSLDLNAEAQVAMIAAMTQGIQDRGKGQRGDKTMLDAWLPAMEAAIEAQATGASQQVMWDNIVDAAEKGAEATQSMVATRGRAARLGERSLGHMDPGAASAVIILRAMREALNP